MLMGVVLFGGGGGLRPPNDCAGDGDGFVLPRGGGGGTARVGGGGGADRGIVGLTLLFGLLAGKDCVGEGGGGGGGGELHCRQPRSGSGRRWWRWQRVRL